MPAFIEVTSANMDWESALGPDGFLEEVTLFCWREEGDDSMVSNISKPGRKAYRIRILFVSARAKEYRIQRKEQEWGESGAFSQPEDSISAATLLTTLVKNGRLVPI